MPINNPTSGTSRQVGKPLPLYKGRGEGHSRQAKGMNPFNYFVY